MRLATTFCANRELSFAESVPVGIAWLTAALSPQDQLLETGRFQIRDLTVTVGR
jgi:hypothetical protein